MTLDAKVNGFQKFIGKSGDGQSNWSEFHKFFERFLFKKTYISIEAPEEIIPDDESEENEER